MLPKFYYINLDRSEDRLKHMQKFFRKIEKKTDLKPRYQRVCGFDGGKMIVDNYSNLKLKNMWLNREQGRKAIGPEFGCTYSHLKGMKLFLDDKENNDDVAFICEDDLELFKIEKRFFVDIINQIVVNTAKYDIVAVSCVGSPIIIEPMSNNLKGPTFLGYYNNRGKLYGTGCYAISRKMATELVKKFWKDDKLIIDPNHNSMVADHFIYPQSKNTTFLIPSLFTLRRENDSYIHSEHLEMHEKVQITMFNMWNNFNVTKVSEIAIFSNNDWGEEYYLSNNKKINTPTIGTKFSPEDYIKLIENFEEFMQVEIKKEESDLDYPVGKLESNDKKILVYFTGENDWNDAFKNWEERKKLLPKKSSILFKICDRKFKGELDVELLNKFDKIKLSKKVIFLSDFYKSKNKIPNKLDARFIPEKFSDNKNKCCPDGKKLYQICGIN